MNNESKLFIKTALKELFSRGKSSIDINNEAFFKSLKIVERFIKTKNPNYYNKISEVFENDLLKGRLKDTIKNSYNKLNEVYYSVDRELEKIVINVKLSEEIEEIKDESILKLIRDAVTIFDHNYSPKIL